MVRCVILYTDNTFEVRDIDDGDKEYSKIVGGQIGVAAQGIETTPYMALVNAITKISELPMNELGKTIFPPLGLYNGGDEGVLGNAIVLQQDEQSLSDGQLKEIKKLCDDEGAEERSQ